MRHKILDSIREFMGVGNVDGIVEMEYNIRTLITYNTLESLYEGRIDANSIIYTDNHKSYIQFAKDLELEYKKIARSHYKNDIYHINHVNSLHSSLKI